MSIRKIPGEHPEPSGAELPSGCARPGCNHPVALHSNGETGCKAFACGAGGTAPCEGCPGRECGACHGTGRVRLPCPSFVPAALAESQLAS